MTQKHNPFKFGSPVDGEYYFPRETLSHQVRNYTDHRNHIVLIGPRRFGKTSFVLNFLKSAEKRGHIGLFVDIFNITSHRDFLRQLLRAIQSHRSTITRIKDFIRYLARIRPSLQIEADPITGHISYNLSTSSIEEQDIKGTIQDTLLSLEHLGDNVILVFDEFQKISEIDDHGWLEATLRTSMQQMKKTSCVFTGSRRSAIHDLLNNPSRPFFRSCQIIDFPPLEEGFVDWIVSKFNAVGISCDKEAILCLDELVQRTPNYIQMACFHLVAAQISHVNKAAIDQVMDTIVNQNAYAYQTLLNSLTLLQQRALRLAACESGQIYARGNLEKYEITNGAALSSAIKSLRDKQILDETSIRGYVLFDDPLFAFYLKRLHTS